MFHESRDAQEQVMSKNSVQTWLTGIVLAVGVLAAAIAGLFAYVGLTATPLHPDPKAVPSAPRSAPLPRWADAVEQGRGIVRAGLTAQNLPGLSLTSAAVGLLLEQRKLKLDEEIQTSAARHHS